MIRPFASLAIILLALGSLTVRADSYRLRNGGLIEGEPISFDARGVVFRKPDNQFSERAGWTNFTEAALKQLAEIPEAQRFTDEYILEEEEPEEDLAQQEIKPKEHPRLERLPEAGGIGSLFRSPLSLALLILVYVANLYAGFEIAVFRNYPAWLGSLVAALIPFVGPIVLLCLPTRLERVPQPVYDTSHEPYVASEETEPGSAEAAPIEAPAAAQAQAPLFPPTTVYQRGTTSFNRRFFETKLASFMKVVPTEEDKDMLLLVKSARGDYTATRISRITPDDLQIHINKAGATADVTIPFTEIKEVKVCHKEAMKKP